MTENLKLSAYTAEHVETQNTPQRIVTMEPMQQTGHFTGRANRQDRTTSSTGQTEQYNRECAGCGPIYELKLPHVRS